MDNEQAKKFEARQKVYRRLIQQFCLMDDTYMSVFFTDRRCAELLLKIILGRDLMVYEVKTQYGIKNLQGRSSVLDIFARDENNKVYNVEVQNSNEGAVPERARYYCGIIDSAEPIKSEDWRALPETFVIFITRNDVLGGNLPIYHIERQILELNVPFRDRAHIVYVNSSLQEDTDLGRLMHDFYCRNAEDMYNKELSERADHLKNEEKGVNGMCEIMEKLWNDGKTEGMEEGVQTGLKLGLKQGREEGIQSGVANALKNMMLSLGVPLDKAMDILNIAPEERALYTRLVNA